MYSRSSSDAGSYLHAQDGTDWQYSRIMSICYSDVVGEGTFCRWRFLLGNATSTGGTWAVSARMPLGSGALDHRSTSAGALADHSDVIRSGHDLPNCVQYIRQPVSFRTFARSRRPHSDAARAVDPDTLPLRSHAEAAIVHVVMPTLQLHSPDLDSSTTTGYSTGAFTSYGPAAAL